jgi:hypothetical protein
MEKQILMYIPDGSNEQHPVVQYLLERYALFTNFIDFHTAFKEKYFYNSKTKQHSTFCVLDSLIEDAYKPNNITLVSLDTSKTIVYAIIIFNIYYIPLDDNYNPIVGKEGLNIYIEFLCSNQSLPPSGEGTKLLKIVEDACYQTNYHHIMLDTTERSMQFYKDNNYHKRLEDDYMQKNTRALNNWRKARMHLSVRARNQLDAKYQKLKSDRKTERILKLGRGYRQKRNKTKRQIKYIK